MSYIQFEKSQLNDLFFSKERELILVSNAGAYSSTTLSTCNTRKYHGLFVTRQPKIDDNFHVLLANLDETIITNKPARPDGSSGGNQFSLAVHQYPGVYHPEGHLLLENFTYEQAPEWHFQADGIKISKQALMCKEENRLLLKYEVIEADSKFRMQFQPFLAFRNVHSVRWADFSAKTKSKAVSNGIEIQPYQEYTPLYMQFSKSVDYVASPDWYYDIEYIKELERGYDFRESLLVPGYFEAELKKGDQLIFSAGLSEVNTKTLKTKYSKELQSNIALNNFDNCLTNAANQFFITNGKQTEVMAGWHWFGSWGRDTFIALPGLTSVQSNAEGIKTFKSVLDTMVKNMQQGLFPNVGTDQNAAFNSVDAPLWFFWSLQQYAKRTGKLKTIWNEYGAAMTSILDHFRKGDTLHNIHMEENGLLYAGNNNIALTWMDAMVDGHPVTPRTGLAVEINALWYNAIRFALKAASEAGDDIFKMQWAKYPAHIEQAFRKTFWDEQKGYLADYVNGDYTDWSLRPNQLIALSLPFTPLRSNSHSVLSTGIDESIAKSVLEITEKELLTPLGLRTLSPNDPNYRDSYYGDQRNRDLAYHNGTVWPWLLGPFAEAYLRIYGSEGVGHIKTIINGFEDVLTEYGIGTIAEIYEGHSPHRACGAISQAWSVAEIVRIKKLLLQYEDEEVSERTAELEA